MKGNYRGKLRANKSCQYMHGHVNILACNNLKQCLMEPGVDFRLANR